ncbi:HNH endonuclease [Neobacillus mesonae]|nr:HNH endonuclease [Neobacillus mesonae]
MKNLTKEGTECELCGRWVPVTTVHHLTPREEGGSHLPTANLCIPCHKQIHHLYTNRELVIHGLTSIEALQADDRIVSYLKWIRKQASTSIPRSKKSKNVRSKGRG